VLLAAIPRSLAPQQRV